MHRVEELLNQMTLEEKVSMVAGSGTWHSTGVERLGVPPIKVTDGPNGARGDGQSGASAVCFPVGSCLAATWDCALIEQVGAALGEEAKTKGAQILLGPTVNIHRTPLGGRNFECYSEDPWLTARMAVAFIGGVQSQGVGTSIKHFVCNDSEFQRYVLSSDVGERALREIYLLPFEAAVKEAEPWTVMSAYNRINGIFASSHHELLTEVLKGEWGFQGFVVSDWGASLHTVENANGGLDLEMPGPARTMGDKLLQAVHSGEVAEETIDDKVRRLLRVTVLSGRMDHPDEVEEQAIDRPEHRALARRVAAEGMVLIKNEDILPFDEAALKTVAVIGPNAELGQIQGGGSSGVKPHYEVHPLAALRERLGDSARLIYEPGCTAHRYLPAFDPAQLRPAAGGDRGGLTIEYFDSPDFSGEPVLTDLEQGSKVTWFGGFARDVQLTGFTARLSGSFVPTESGVHGFSLMSAGLGRLLLNGEQIVDNWTSQTRGDSFYAGGSTEVRGEVELEAGVAYELCIEYRRGEEQLIAGLQFGALPPVPADLIERAVAAAEGADAAILVVGTNGEWETEGNDRRDLRLPGRQDELIEAVCAANPRTVVVMNAGSPVAMPWLERAPAVLQAWFPGQEFGNAMVDVLLGQVNPSGRLPSTFPVRIEDTPSFTNYPGEHRRVLYGEGLFVGYRWYDTRDIEPLLPFGHGLSYTSFEYGELSVDAEQRMGEIIHAELDVTNSGARAGSEVVQLYVRDPESRLTRPWKELKAFEKVSLAAGETRRVSFVLDERALAFWDPGLHEWVMEPGEFQLLVGASSRDIRTTAKFELLQ